MNMLRPTRRGLAAGAVAAVVAGVTMQVSFALPTTSSPYVIEGTVLTQTEPEKSAAIFDDASGSSPELGPVNASSTKLGVIHGAPKPMLGLTNPNAQVDLKNVWLDTATDSSGDIWLYLAWQRDSNKGSGVIMYEFQQGAKPVACDYSVVGTPSEAELIAACNPFQNRQPGDFILVWDQQGGSTAIGIRTWGYADANGDGDFDAGTDTLTLGSTVTTASDDAEARYSSDKYFGEATVNLSDTIFPPTPTSCFTVGNIVPGTVTGNSDTADYKDIVLDDFAESLTISNCGIVEITKDTNPEGGTGQFGYTLARAGGADLDYASPPNTARTGTLTSDGDSEQQVNLRAGTNYTLAENIGAGTPYDLDSIVCTLGSSTFTVTTGTSFPVAAGETTSCLITNQLKTGTLNVTKVVTNDNGGTASAEDFSFSVDGAAAVPFEADGTNSLVVDEGSYDVVEDGLPIAGYSTTYDNCANVFVPAGGEATCTITNDDRAATLIVTKVVVNDNGGELTFEDFSYEINGGAAIAFEADGSNSQSVSAGTYTVTEPAVAGYTQTGNTCVDVVIANGETKECTITNDDAKASPSGTTTQRWVLHDTLGVNGLRAGAPDAADATATFLLYSDPGCSTLVDDETVDVSGSAASTLEGIGVDEPGDYFWRVQYSGDQFNTGFTTACGDEVTQIFVKDHDRNNLVAGP